MVNLSYNNNSYNGGRQSGFNGRRKFDDVGASMKKADYSAADLVAIKKDIYVENEAIAKKPQSEIDAFLTAGEVTLKGKDIPRPITDFAEGSFPAPVTKCLLAKYSAPTTIQAVSWPLAMSGRDIISIARTGSGKTLGFLLPAMMHIMSQPKRRRNDGPIVLVMLPTRELAQQVEEVAEEYCQAMKLSYMCCFGGAPRGPQAGALRRGVDICIATPGRLLDFLESGTTNMMRCSYLVLDEADRMLDMGFEPQIRKILSQIRDDRQTLMFSATWPDSVRKLAADFQKNPTFLNVGSMELSTNHNITQHIEILEDRDKEERLCQLMNQILENDEHKTIVFVDTKRKADHITMGLRNGGIKAFAIHGDKKQSERDWVLNEFRNGKAKFLVATDVAARGLDVSDVKFVVNYDFPNNTEDYVHRIGRTGRRDQKGVAYTFFTRKDSGKARDLVSLLEEAKQEIPASLRQMGGRGGGGSSGPRYGNRSNNWGGGGGGGGGYKRNQSDFGASAVQAKRIKFDDNGSYDNAGKGYNKAGNGAKNNSTKFAAVADRW